MELENILYGGVQLVHNFGAAAVTGLPVAALWFKPAPPVLRKMAWLTLLAWLVQSASGAGFGTVSFFQEGELPEIHHLALACALRENCLRGAGDDPAHGSFSYGAPLPVRALLRVMRCGAVWRSSGSRR